MRTLSLFILLIVPLQLAAALDSDFSNAVLPKIELDAEQMQWLRSNRNLRIGIQTDIPPYSYLDFRHNVRGMFNDYVQLFQDYLPVKFEVIDIGTSSVTNSIFYERDLDLVFHIASSEDEIDTNRKTKTFITIPVAGIGIESISGFRELGDLNGKKLGTVENSPEEQWLQEDYPGIEQLTIQNLESGLELLSNGEIHGLVGPRASLLWLARDHEDILFQPPFDTPCSYRVGLAARKDRIPIVAIINAVLSEIEKHETEYQYAKWTALEHAKKAKAEDYYRTSGPLIVALSLVSLAGILLVINLRLKDRKRQKLANSLKRSEGLLLKTGSLAQLAGWDIDPGTGKMNCTDNMVNILEKAPNQYKTQDEFVKLFAEEERAELLKSFGSIRERVSSFEVELKYKPPLNASKWVKISCHSTTQKRKRTILSGTVQDVTARKNLELKILDRNRSIQNLLDFSGEGFLSFGPDLIVNPEYSRECIDIFGSAIEGKLLANLLYGDEQAKRDFSDAMTMVFNEVSLPEIIFEVLDSKVKIGDKTLKADYHLVDRSTIMCQFTDITETELLQKKIKEENSNRDMILRAVSSKHDFASAISEAESIFTRIGSCFKDDSYTAGEKENDRIIRAVHTFKANAAFLRMSDTVERTHLLETALIDYGVLSGSSPIGACLSHLRTAFENDCATITNALGGDWSIKAHTVDVDLDKIDQAKEFIRAKYPEDANLYSKIDQLSSLRLSGLLNRLSDVTEQLAGSHGKRVSIESNSGEIHVSTALFRVLSDSLNHIMRNMIAHGIEFPGQREKAGKALEGKITINANRKDGHIELVLSDDGVGISIEKIKEKAMKSGIIGAGDSRSDLDYISLIFHPGFSTADTVTAVSGRGYGLSAVKENIYELGGKIKVKSAKGRGTTFTIIIPETEKETA